MQENSTENDRKEEAVKGLKNIIKKNLDSKKQKQATVDQIEEIKELLEAYEDKSQLLEAISRIEVQKQEQHSVTEKYQKQQEELEKQFEELKLSHAQLSEKEQQILAKQEELENIHRENEHQFKLKEAELEERQKQLEMKELKAQEIYAQDNTDIKAIKSGPSDKRTTKSSLINTTDENPESSDVVFDMDSILNEAQEQLTKKTANQRGRKGERKQTKARRTTKSKESNSKAPKKTKSRVTKKRGRKKTKSRESSIE